MSVRKRTWTNARGDAKEAWVVDYVDQVGKRRLKTFKRKKDADAYRSRTDAEVRAGVHTPDSASVTIAKAAELWLRTCRANDLERGTIAAYRQYIENHIVPLIGSMKLLMWRQSAPSRTGFGKTDRARWSRKSWAR
jgi:integrase